MLGTDYLYRIGALHERTLIFVDIDLLMSSAEREVIKRLAVLMQAQVQRKYLTFKFMEGRLRPFRPNVTEFLGFPESSVTIAE